jgi:hypothetical protein
MNVSGLSFQTSLKVSLFRIIFHFPSAHSSELDIDRDANRISFGGLFDAGFICLVASMERGSQWIQLTIHISN